MSSVPPAGSPSGKLTSPAFVREGGELRIPDAYTCTGAGTSPPLVWTGAFAEAAAEFAIVVVDPDARGFVHWVAGRIPGDITELPEGAGDVEAGNGLLQGKNDFGGTGYDGPCPPPGRPHHYVFTLYAFAEPPDFSNVPTAKEVIAAAGDAPTATLTALYGR